MINLPIPPSNQESNTQPIQVQLRIQIPQKYHQQPIISQLAFFYLKVNIVAALLGKDGVGGGWFDLELEGRYQHIQEAIIFLQENGVIVWQNSVNPSRLF